MQATPPHLARKRIIEGFPMQITGWNDVLKGCVIENGWCFFHWSSKGIIGKMPWPWFPLKGKPEKKAVFSLHCWDETTTYITEPIEIQRIGIVFSRTNRLKLWVASVCCGGSSIFGGFPLKGMVGPIAFLSGKQEKQGGLHYKETAPCPVQAGYGAASSHFEGNRELHAAKRMGHEAGGPLPLLQAFPGRISSRKR